MRNVSPRKSSKASCKNLPNLFRVKKTRKDKCSVEQQEAQVPAVSSLHSSLHHLLGVYLSTAVGLKVVAFVEKYRSNTTCAFDKGTYSLGVVFLHNFICCILQRSQNQNQNQNHLFSLNRYDTCILGQVYTCLKPNDTKLCCIPNSVR